MESKIAKLLENKYENVVQFNVTNTTSSPIYIDLFNTSQGLSNIPSTPTYIYPPNSVVTTYGSGVYNFSIVSNIGFLYAIKISSNELDIYDLNNTLVTTLTIGINLDSLVYNYNDNTLYITDSGANLIYIVDCNTNTVLTSISTPFGFGWGVYNGLNNSIYYSAGSSGLHIVNCDTNTVSVSFALPPTFSTIFYIALDDDNNYLYMTDNGVVNAIGVFDCTSNTYLSNITIPSILAGGFLTLNQQTNTLYISQSDIGIIDCTTNTFISSISLTASILPSFACVDTLNNQIYFACQDGSTLLLNGTTNSIVLNDSIATAPLIYCVFNPITNSVIYNYLSASTLLQFTTIGITTSSYYISGSSNYNFFLNNLNAEPIIVQMIRIFVGNQEQLYNQFQLTKIDSDGNQIFLPDFPINQVSSFQQQGNISELKLEDVVFDGRTYINQYKLNANETISMEIIYYIQIDRFSATPDYPLLFKPKIQLKEYLKLN